MHPRHRLAVATHISVAASAVFLLAASAPAIAGQTAPRPRPDRIEIVPDRGTAVVALEGRELEAYAEARIVDLRRGAPAPGFRVALGPIRGTSRSVEIGTAGASPGEYTLELVSEKGATRVGLAVTVAEAGAEVVEFRAPSEVDSGTPFTVEVRARFPSGGGKVTLEADGRDISIEARGADASLPVEMPALGEGTYPLTVRVLDAAGGEADVATHMVTVLPAPAVSALSLSASEAASGDQITGTLRLDRTASGVTAVTLQADAASVTVPATVVVPAGTDEATFSVSVGELAQDARTEIAAALGEEKVTAPLVLVGPPRLSEFAVYGGNVSGGGQVMVNEPGDVAVRARLDRPAPPQGTEVRLTTTVPNLVDLPGTMTVPAGQSELVIQVGHSVSPSLIIGAISGSIGPVQLDYAIRFEPPAIPMPVSLEVHGPGIPASSSISAVGGVTLTAVVELLAPAPAGGVGIHFSDAFLGPVGGVNQVIPAGTQTYEIVLQTPRVDAVRASTPWVRADGASFHTVEAQVELRPVPSQLESLTFDEPWVTPFQDRIATVVFAEPAPVEREVVLGGAYPDGGTWQGRRMTVPPGQVEASASVAGLGNGEAPGDMTVTASYGGSQTQAVITRHPAVQVQALLLDPAAPYAGDLVTVSVVLEDPAPPAGAELVVQGLTSSLLMPEPRQLGNSTVVTFPPGATSASFVLEARQATAQAMLSVSNPLGGSMSRQFAVHAPVSVSQIQAGDTFDGGNGSRFFQVLLSGDAPTPVEVTLATDRPDVVGLPASVTFAAGIQSRSVSFDVLVDPAPGAAIPFTISASFGGETVVSSHTLVHSAPTLASFEVVPIGGRTVFRPGDEVRLRWTLDRHPSQTTTVELTPELAGILVNFPPTLVMSSMSETHTFQLAGFDSPGDLEIRARTGSVERSVTIPLVLSSLTPG